MANTTIHPGQEIILQATFQVLQSGVWVVTDPATVLFYVASPSATSPTRYVYGTDVQVVKVSTGIYTYTFVPHIPGKWTYGYESTGSGAAAQETTFWVSNSMLYT